MHSALLALRGTACELACDHAIAYRALATPGAAGIVSSMAESSLLSRITVDPKVCHGKPCIRGLRYPVEFVLDLLSGGTTAEQILADYPDLEPDDLRAVYAYAAQLSRVQRIDPAVA
jgi:uncharacterized protein (DUF433 family)